MHNHHLAPCDVKIQNILVEIVQEVPRCFLRDFGITQVLSSEALATMAFDVINARGLSAPYASPESFRNIRSRIFISVDYKKYDVYSYACVMLEVLTRKPAWTS